MEGLSSLLGSPSIKSRLTGIQQLEQTLNKPTKALDAATDLHLFLPALAPLAQDNNSKIQIGALNAATRIFKASHKDERKNDRTLLSYIYRSNSIL